jgi:outer membrane lipoprotein-sorting protein
LSKNNQTMKKLKTLLALALVTLVSVAKAQTADAVIDKYFAAIGGKDKMAAITSVKMTGKGKQQGMEFPMVGLQKAPNKMRQTINFQGKEIVAGCFDGKESWSTNFMTMKPEKAEAEDSENAAKEMDFPDPFLNYKDKGYSIALEGEETIEGVVCSKIKLTKKPIKVDGKDEENSSFYFFDKDNGALIMNRNQAKKGQTKGMVLETFMSDYQEVNGVFFPFSVSQKVNGNEAFALVMEKVEINVAIDDKEFGFPKE